MKPLVKIRAIFAAISLAVPMLAMATAPASAITLEEITSRGSVRIGVVTGAPPMGMVDESGNPTGYDVDVANLIAGYLGVTAELVPLTPPSRIPALQTGKVDFLVATLAPTGERAKTVMFTQPYSAFNMVIVSGPDQKFAQLSELEGKRVGVNRGSSQEAALRRVAVPGLEIVVFEDDFDNALRRSLPARSMRPRYPRRLPTPSFSSGRTPVCRSASPFSGKATPWRPRSRISRCTSGSTPRSI